MNMLSEYLCVFLKYKNADMQNGLKNGSTCSQNGLSESPGRRGGDTTRLCREEYQRLGAWLHVRNKAKVYLWPHELWG